MTTRVPSLWCAAAAAVALVGCGDQPLAEDRPAAGPDRSLTAIDLGWHPVGEAVAIEVPADALGVTVAASGSRVGIQSVRRPDAASVVDGFALSGVVRYEPPLAASAIAVGLPQSDAAIPLVGGPWTLVLGQDGDGAPGGAELTAWIRRPVGTAGGGRIDVNLFAAESTASSAYLLDVLALAFDGFAGMKLGEVASETLDAASDPIEDDEQVRALFEATRNAALAPAVNVIVVTDMSGLLGAPKGRAGGVPGLGCVHGTELSGLLVEVSGDRDFDAARIRHEAGHLAGLFHTSDGYGFDALADTPECADPSGERCPDAGNVMFPRATRIPRVELSDAQVRVVRGSTLYRGD